MGQETYKLQRCFAYRQKKLKVVQRMLNWEDTCRDISDIYTSELVCPSKKLRQPNIFPIVVHWNVGSFTGTREDPNLGPVASVMEQVL